MAEIIAMPKLGFDMAEGTLVRWVVGEGEKIEKGQVLAEIETDKATVEVESSAEGIVYRHLVKAGDIVPVGTPIAVIAAPGEEVKELPGEPPAEQAKAAAEQPQPAQQAEISAGEATALPSEGDSRTKASPLARRMANEYGINLREVKGSGPGGRVVKRDIENALKAAPAQPPAVSEVAAVPYVVPAAPTPVAVSSVMPVPSLEDQRVGVDKLRAIIGRRMVESKTQIPHFYLTSEVDMAAVMELRKQFNSQLPEEQKLSVNDFIIKAAALALRQYPNLNASLQGNEIVRHGHRNIGVAVALESGLITIVCKDADYKSLGLISQEVKEMVGRARAGKVRPEDIEGSTFSISNLGMFDVEHFVAIINPPEAAILAVGSVREVPVVENGVIKAGLRMKMTLSADHRITDGAEAARFMQALKNYLEKPALILL
ncbi:MAG: 2-oxo acid dehydrogenase subunit E2 [Bellilinea sp.]|nr:2-oxo acid dehydrogenase subunit E2 [Bellilinea sp.]